MVERTEERKTRISNSEGHSATFIDGNLYSISLAIPRTELRRSEGYMELVFNPLSNPGDVVRSIEGWLTTVKQEMRDQRQ